MHLPIVGLVPAELRLECFKIEAERLGLVQIHRASAKPDSVVWPPKIDWIGLVQLNGRSTPGLRTNVCHSYAGRVPSIVVDIGGERVTSGFRIVIRYNADRVK